MNANERSLVEFLLDGWEGALHNVDTLFQIAQEIPNLATEFRRWEIDTLDRLCGIPTAIAQFIHISSIPCSVIAVTDSALPAVDNCA